MPWLWLVLIGVGGIVVGVVLESVALAVWIWASARSLGDRPPRHLESTRETP